jgi:hypothetical protein
MKLGTQTGSLINHVATEANQPEPKVGDGATLCYWSDRHAGTVIAWDGKTVTVQQDKANRVNKGVMTDSQQYTYEADPTGGKHQFQIHPKKGRWVPVYPSPKTGKLLKCKSGTGLWLGVRDEHFDYSF